MSASRANDLGQLLIIGLEEDRWSSALEKRLQAIRPGGILLTQQNLRTPETTVELLAKIARSLDPPPFLALEEEGGAVNPLRAFFPPLPTPHIAAVKGLHRVERLGSLIGEAFTLLGFNLNFAPRLDLANHLVNPPLEPQFFSSDPRTVAQSGEAFVTGLLRNNIMACGKHFPGLSAAVYAGDSPLPVVAKPMVELWRSDILPFRHLLPRLAMVKLSYAAYKAYDLDLQIPACESENVLDGLLRVKLNYTGVAVVDHFEALKEMAKAFGPSRAGEPKPVISLNVEASAKSINAGADMLVIAWKAFDVVNGELRKALEGGTLPAPRIEEAVERIGRVKKGLRLPPGKFSKKSFERLCRDFESFNKECKSAEREIV